MRDAQGHRGEWGEGPTALDPRRLGAVGRDSRLCSSDKLRLNHVFFLLQ